MAEIWEPVVQPHWCFRLRKAIREGHQVRRWRPLGEVPFHQEPLSINGVFLF
jgi:hypothetical protein